MTGQYPVTPGITFRIATSGWFHLGSVNPRDGEVQGQAARTKLALTVTVTIPDARAFMRDRDHPGTLDAAIDLVPLGRDLRSSRGTFNLLEPATAQGCRNAVLECAFDARGTSYYLAARTDIRPGAGGNAHREITMVPVTLHEGAATDAPIVGAGVLTLTADELARLVSSARVTDAESLGESTLTLTGFGRFFLGDLWEAYAHPPGASSRRWQTVVRGMRRLAGRR